MEHHRPSDAGLTPDQKRSAALAKTINERVQDGGLVLALHELGASFDQGRTAHRPSTRAIGGSLRRGAAAGGVQRGEPASLPTRAGPRSILDPESIRCLTAILKIEHWGPTRALYLSFFAAFGAVGRVTSTDS